MVAFLQWFAGLGCMGFPFVECGWGWSLSWTGL